MSKELLPRQRIGEMAIPTDNDGNSLHNLEENHLPDEKIPVVVDESASIDIRSKGRGKEITMYGKHQEPNINAEKIQDQFNKTDTNEKLELKTPGIRSTRKRSHERKNKVITEQIEDTDITTSNTIPDFSSQTDIKQTVQINPQNNIPLKKRKRPDSPLKRLEKIREIRKTERLIKDAAISDDQDEKKNKSKEKEKPLVSEEVAAQMLLHWCKYGVTIRGQKYKVKLVPENHSPAIDTTYLEQHGFSPGLSTSQAVIHSQQQSLSVIPEATEENVAQIPVLNFIGEDTGEDPLDSSYTDMPMDLSLKVYAKAEEDLESLDEEANGKNLNIIDGAQIDEPHSSNTVDGADFEVEAIENNSNDNYSNGQGQMVVSAYGHLQHFSPVPYGYGIPGNSYLQAQSPNVVTTFEDHEYLHSVSTEPMSHDSTARGENLPSLEQGTQNITLDSGANSQPDSGQFVTPWVTSPHQEQTIAQQPDPQASVRQLFQSLYMQNLLNRLSSTSNGGNQQSQGNAPSMVNVLPEVTEAHDGSQTGAPIAMLIDLGMTTDDGSLATTETDRVKERLSSMLNQRESAQ